MWIYVPQYNLIHSLMVIKTKIKNINRSMIKWYISKIPLPNFFKNVFSIQSHQVCFRWYPNIRWDNTQYKENKECGSIIRKVEIKNLCINMFLKKNQYPLPLRHTAKHKLIQLKNKTFSISCLMYVLTKYEAT